MIYRLFLDGPPYCTWKHQGHVQWCPRDHVVLGVKIRPLYIQGMFSSHLGHLPVEIYRAFSD